MSFGWQQQQQPGQHQQMQQQQNFHLHSQKPTFSEPFAPVQQQQQNNQHPQQNNMNTATSAMPPNAMPGLNHSASFNGIPSAFSNGGQDQSNNVDLNSILSNYHPKMISTQLQQHMPFSQHQQDQMHQQMDSASAAAAVAAYGHLGMQQGQNSANMGGGFNANPSNAMQMNQQIQQNGSMQVQMPRAMSGAAWNAMQNQQSFPTPSQLHAQMMNDTRGGSAVRATGGYEGDASGTSSTQTPGASSGDDVNAGGKKRSNTISHEPKEGSLAALANSGYGVGGTSTSEAFANESGPGGLYRGGSSLKAPPQRPSLRHRRSHSGSQAVSSNSVSWASETTTQGGKRLSGPNLSFNTNTSPISSYAPNLHGHAASHPPGLGGQVLRGADIGTGGNNAATDFTKRKGWHNRIVDELLDFVHVLDENGKVVHAASSVGTLTGWKLEELRGRMITDFIHKDDAKAFMDEFQSCLKERKEMTMYYRFRKKPQTAEDKRRVRDQRLASNVGPSNSGSASEGDSSSNQESVNKSMTTFADGMTEARAENDDEDESELRDDREARYVVFEVTGHPYFSDDQEDGFGQVTDGLEPTSPMMNSNANSTQTSPISKKITINESDNSVKKEDEDETNNRIQCFFLTGRVYPTKNIGMLDSFLELKLENERLRLLLGELSVNDGTIPLPADGSSDGRRSLDEGAYPIDYPVDLESNKTASTGHGGFGQTGNGSMEDLSATRRASLTSPRMNASAPTSPQQLQMERSITSNTIGASTNAGEESDEAESPLLDGTDESKRKKKKPKQEEGDYVCTDCGRVDSPEWRKGPLGPKTLCNACGLRWAKKIKRSGGDPNAVSKAGAAAKAQSAGKVLGSNSIPSLPSNLGQNHSFASASGEMQRPPMTSSQSSSAAMFASMHQPPHPGIPHSASSFDTSFSSMQAAMYSASPTQMNFGPHTGPIPGHMDHPGAMPPLMHHNSSFMSQSPAAPQMGNQMSQQQQQQQQQQQIQYGQNQAGLPPNHMMY
ncbi:uncharacterized protein FA14DRAFT_153400 [Meira miltonrushii]|uniref:GATA-type domain-containing protein n=1 Tax=Meira miltonrushii TaxID=1280837 RepID=A0A316VPI2_9BASI|nr:uncharacterized protein FA14DRAFT_153400 [Meira miltonrushii]PWN38061.1 hypothetical protein FA14DRAFT_153400 [Meira miltonrushii]